MARHDVSKKRKKRIIDLYFGGHTLEDVINATKLTRQYVISVLNEYAKSSLFNCSCSKCIVPNQ